MSESDNISGTIERDILAEQVRLHYAQIPAMAIAPTLGGIFTVWVLWDAVNNLYLVIGICAVIALAIARLVVYRRYRRNETANLAGLRWRYIAVAASFASGCIWGSAAIFLFPAERPGYDVYLLVLLSLLPVIGATALASYLPAFYAYFIPCFAPFVVSLALQDQRGARMAAVLLMMMMGAMMAFAIRYSRNLRNAIELKLQLGEKTRALEETAAHRTRFLAAASHDLRQPVHAMGLFLESLRDRVRGLEETAWVQHLIASLHSLRDMLNDMLDLSKLDARVVNARPHDFSVAQLCDKLAAEYAPLAARKRLLFRRLGRDAVVHSDPALLERMLRNLLSNAVRYTAHGGIALACRARRDHVLLQVYDTGVGIRASDLSDVFREFTRIENRPAHDDGEGLGLGLAIVERLAVLLNHSVHARSNFGRGSVFSVVVARGRGPARPLIAPVEEPPVTDAKVGLIMIIDDDERVGAATAALVRQWGNRALYAKTPDAACAAVNGEVPDLLIVDYRLESVTAPTAITLLHQRFQKKVPALMITGDTAPQRIREAYDAGYMLLHKPVDPQRLRACIAALGHTGN